MKTKYIAFILVLVLLFSLSACGGEQKNSTTQAATTQKASESTKEASESKKETGSGTWLEGERLDGNISSAELESWIASYQ